MEKSQFESVLSPSGYHTPCHSKKAPSSDLINKCLALLSTCVSVTGCLLPSEDSVVFLTNSLQAVQEDVIRGR